MRVAEPGDRIQYVDCQSVTTGPANHAWNVAPGISSSRSKRGLWNRF